MQELISGIEELRQGEVGKAVKERMQEFVEVFKDEDKVFSELCFCITTANSSAQMGLKVQEALRSEIKTIGKEALSKKLRELGYRFYNLRADYMVKAREHLPIKKTLSGFKDDFQAREWLAQNVLGLGYKESSHFLRNIGYKNLAILDRHIIKVMFDHGMISELPKTLNKKRYLEYEKKLELLCNATKLTQAELDFYLWHMRTGKVLK